MRRPIQIVLALSTMTVASCLITNDPTYEPPPKTAPFFLPDTASPSADTIVQIKDGDSLRFSALMQSEDADVELDARLYLDYGSPTVPGRVFRSQIDARSPTPGAWADGPREVSATYFGEFVMDEGCHRFTLMVIHGNFQDDDDDKAGCPVEDGDYDTQTWLVQYCGNADCPTFVGDCPPIPEDLSTKCPPRTVLPDNTGGSQ